MATAKKFSTVVNGVRFERSFYDHRREKRLHRRLRNLIFAFAINGRAAAETGQP